MGPLFFVTCVALKKFQTNHVFPPLCNSFSQVGCPCNLSLNTRNCISMYFGVDYFILNFSGIKGACYIQVKSSFRKVFLHVRSLLIPFVSSFLQKQQSFDCRIAFVCRIYHLLYNNFQIFSPPNLACEIYPPCFYFPVLTHMTLFSRASILTFIAFNRAFMSAIISNFSLILFLSFLAQMLSSVISLYEFLEISFDRLFSRNHLYVISLRVWRIVFDTLCFSVSVLFKCTFLIHLWIMFFFSPAGFRHRSQLVSFC